MKYFKCTIVIAKKYVREKKKKTFERVACVVGPNYVIPLLCTRIGFIVEFDFLYFNNNLRVKNRRKNIIFFSFHSIMYTALQSFCRPIKLLLNELCTPLLHYFRLIKTSL